MTELTANQFHRGAYLVYLNGLEVPCPSVSVNYGVWQIPEATLSFPPHRLLQRLGREDRVEVVIFFLDTTTDPENPVFRLLFEGEIIGWSYSNSAMGRSMTFNAVADISIFTQMHFFFMSTVDSVVAATTDQKTATGSVTQTGVHYPYSLFMKGLAVNDSDQVPNIDRPFDLLYNLIRGMVASDIKPEFKSIPIVNFFARWARKRNFINRFVALPLFEDGNDPNKGAFPMFRAVQGDFALQAMQNNLSTSVGDVGNIMDVLKSLFGVVYYELAMIPTAPCYRVKLSDATIVGTDANAQIPPAQLNQYPLRLLNYFAKPQMLFGMAPMCNVVFPSMQTSFNHSENYIDQPTRIYVNDSMITGALKSDNALVTSALTFGYPPEANAILQAKNGEPGVTSTNKILSGKNLLIFPEEFYKGPNVAQSKIPSWLQLLNQTDPSIKAGKDSHFTTEEQTTYDKLKALNGLYAEYEFYRQRYEKRGGAADLAWNPYLVPGFPCVLLDQQASAFHTTGYLMQVHQTLTTSSMRTSISYGFGRTINEMLDVMQEDMLTLGVMGAGPADPVDQTRVITQDYVQAEAFYKTLFHGRVLEKGKKASCDLRTLLCYDLDSGFERLSTTGPSLAEKSVVYAPDIADSPLEINVQTADLNTTANAVSSAILTGSFNDASTAATEAALIQANVLEKPTNTTKYPMTSNNPSGKDVITSNLRSEEILRPTPEAAALFQSYDTAMQTVSRPICTIDEYLSFIHGGQLLETLKAAGQVDGESSLLGVFGTTNAVAPYYTRIKRLRQGPGDKPPATVTGADTTPKQSDTGTQTPAVANSVSPVGVGADFPQTRSPWDDVLERYRADVLSREAPLR